MTSVSVQELQSILEEKNDNAVVIDIRLPWQFALGHIPAAINVPWITEALDPAQYSGKTTYLYCPEGVRSGRMAAELSKKGFDVRNVDGGFRAWQEADFLIER